MFQRRSKASQEEQGILSHSARKICRKEDSRASPRPKPPSWPRCPFSSPAVRCGQPAGGDPEGERVGPRCQPAGAPVWLGFLFSLLPASEHCHWAASPALVCGSHLLTPLLQTLCQSPMECRGSMWLALCQHLSRSLLRGKCF